MEAKNGRWLYLRVSEKVKCSMPAGGLGDWSETCPSELFCPREGGTALSVF